MDSRYEKLADVIIGHSTRLKKGENILIQAINIPEEAVLAIMRRAKKAGGLPHLKLLSNRLIAELSSGATQKQLKVRSDIELHEMQKMQAYVSLRGGSNPYEGSGVSSNDQQVVSKALKPILDHRVKKTKWVVLRWPSEGMASKAGMSTEAFENFYFDVCTMDYSLMKEGMNALSKLMASTDKVHLKGPETDLEFSIKGILPKSAEARAKVSCMGWANIPDGEVFTAPVRNSVNGYISFNAPTVYNGRAFENISLDFEDGKIKKATASQTDKLNAILDTDEGARYIGEFALGCNPYILEAMRDILFDEKIAGSFHFTPGECYDEAPNGNKSAIHWDMVSIQRPEHGGGEIWFDGKLIRKDGIFTPASGLCQLLNPAYLKGEISREKAIIPMRTLPAQVGRGQGVPLGRKPRSTQKTH
jgi:aminopeptidase